MTIPTKTLERVRNLLAKAEGTDNEHERDTFMSAAAALMAKYGIEQAMVESTQQERVTPINKRYIVEAGGGWARRRAELLYHVAEALRCKGIVDPGENGNWVVHLFGYPADVERAEMLFTSLLLQMASALNRVQIPFYERSPRAYRNSFLLGYISQVRKMLREREAQAVEEVPQEKRAGTEVALLDRSVVLASEVSAVYPKMRLRKPTTSGGGYGAGRDAGSRANLGGTGLENRRRSLSR
jgi:hypothetical protein